MNTYYNLSSFIMTYYLLSLTPAVVRQLPWSCDFESPTSPSCHLRQSFDDKGGDWRLRQGASPHAANGTGPAADATHGTPYGG